MAAYTFAELEALFIHAGGGPLYAPIAAAVALAESGGCQYALAGPLDIRPFQECTYRQTLGENSFGLWQINLFAHPQYELGNHGLNLFRALVNAEAAVAISRQGRDFNAWSTYTPEGGAPGSGVWRKYLPANVPVPKMPHEDAVLGPMLQPGALTDDAPREHDLERALHSFGHLLGYRLPKALRSAEYYRHLIRSAVK